jgi:hypothetical protein
LEEGKERWGVGILEDAAVDTRNKALIFTQVACLMENKIEVGTLDRETRMLITS